jgi:hypothetical protein
MQHPPMCTIPVLGYKYVLQADEGLAIVKAENQADLWL